MCSGHCCLEAAAGKAMAVDAARSWQELTIEPAFAATADMIATLSHDLLQLADDFARRGDLTSLCNTASYPIDFR